MGYDVTFEIISEGKKSNIEILLMVVIRELKRMIGRAGFKMSLDRNLRVIY